MKAAELVGIGQFRVVDQEIGDPGPGQVQVRVAAVGICGSDLHNFSEGGIADSPCKFPMVLGHEPSGVVIKTGVGVMGIDPGDHFALEPGIACGECEPCRRGRENLCDNMSFMSANGVPGFFCERINMPAHNLTPVPRHVGLREATLVEPLGVALHSLTFAHVQAGETAVVYGTGPIGLLTIAALKAAGVGRVWAVEPLAHRRDMAAAMGADVVLTTDQPVKEIMNDTANRGVDLAFDCAGGPNTVNDCIHSLAKCGRLVYTAVPVDKFIPAYGPAMRKKEISFFNVYRSNHQAERARDLLAENVAMFAPMLTHSRPIGQIQEAFEMNHGYADGVGKMLVMPGE
jgi:L-iditol 2-dehydrogenase